MRATINCSLQTFLLTVLAVATAAGLFALSFRPPPNPHAHAGGGFVVHNESPWAVTLLIEAPSSGSRRVRLIAGESLVLPRRPTKVEVLWRGATSPGGPTDEAAVSLDLTRFGGVSALDYGDIQLVSRRCLAVRMRLGKGAEASVEGPAARRG